MDMEKISKQGKSGKDEYRREEFVRHLRCSIYLDFRANFSSRVAFSFLVP